MFEKPKLKIIAQDGDYSLHEYKPSLTYPLYLNEEKMSFPHRMRFVIDFLHKDSYRVYYLMKNNEILGYCVVSPGGRRLNCSTTNDITLGPYCVFKGKRGYGFSKIMISMVLDFCSYNYDYAYDWVHKGNIPSRKASESCGFYPYGQLEVKGLFRQLVIVEKGTFIVYRYNKKKDNNYS